MNYRSIFLAVLATLALTSCKKESQEQKIQDTSIEQSNASNAPEKPKVVDPNAKFGTMEFAILEHNFGDISEDNIVETVFKFTNTGEADLVISNAKGSCGCTVPEYPKEPIVPGGTGEIKVSFNPKGRNGSQFKTVTLTTNTQKGIEIVHIKANVVN